MAPDLSADPDSDSDTTAANGPAPSSSAPPPLSPLSPLTQPPGVLRLPGPAEQLARRAGRLPWWAIILVTGLVLAFFGIITTPLYHDALTYVTNNPAFVTGDFQRVTYRVTQDGQVQTVAGMITAQDAQSITIRIIDAADTTVPRAVVGTVTKNGDQVLLIVPARPVSGVFYTESATEYQIEQPDGSIIAVKKIDVRPTEQRTPANCNADIHGSCQIAVTVPASQVSGRLISESVSEYVVETTAPQLVTIPRTAISLVISENPGQCALNNLASCQSGIFLTIFLTLVSYSLALLIGLIIALMRISSRAVARNVAILYIEIVRGIPILVILLIFYFAIGPYIRDTFHIPMPEATRAILGLSFAYGAFLAEIFRAGIQSINRGQMEAARSLGMTYFQAMRNVILPQAIRVVLPPLGNDFIAMLKDTSLVAAISQHELTYLAIQFESERLKAFEPFLTIAALYLVMTLLLSFLVRVIESRTRLPGLL